MKINRSVALVAGANRGRVEEFADGHRLTPFDISAERTYVLASAAGSRTCSNGVL